MATENEWESAEELKMILDEAIVEYGDICSSSEVGWTSPDEYERACSSYWLVSRQLSSVG